MKSSFFRRGVKDQSGGDSPSRPPGNMQHAKPCIKENPTNTSCAPPIVFIFIQYSYSTRTVRAHSANHDFPDIGRRIAMNQTFLGWRRFSLCSPLPNIWDYSIYGVGGFGGPRWNAPYQERNKDRGDPIDYSNHAHCDTVRPPSNGFSRLILL
jgi:hypothetical protein